MKISETIQYKLVEARTKYKDQYGPYFIEEIEKLLDLVKDYEVNYMNIVEAVKHAQTIGECEVGTIRKIAIQTMIDEIKLSENYRKIIAIDEKGKQK